MKLMHTMVSTALKPLFDYNRPCMKIELHVDFGALVLFFCGGRNTREPRENPLMQRQEQAANSTQL